MVTHALGQRRLGELASAIGSFDGKRNRRGRNLRDYQRDAISEVGRFLKESLENLRNGDSVSGAIVMPWGSGKTIVAAEIARRLGLRALMLSPTKEILRQNEVELARWNPGISTSVYFSGEHDLSGQIIVTTYHSALSLLKRHALPEVDMVFYDEAHRSISELRQKLHGVAGPIEIGLTATPAFSEDRHIWQFFGKTIYEMGFEDAIAIGALAPLRAFMVDTKVDVSRVTLKCSGGILDERAAERELNIMARNRAARDFFIEGLQKAPTVAYCISVRHADDFASFLKKSGVRAEPVHAAMPDELRKRRLAAFENGDLDLLTSRDVMIEGWNSHRVAAELCLRPTFSHVVKGQMMGRVLRPDPAKECGIVVEFQDIYKRSQQPILIHHLFGKKEYLQGELMAAPELVRVEEEGRRRRGETIRILGLKVTSEIRHVPVLGKEEERKRLEDEMRKRLEDYKRAKWVWPILKMVRDKRLSEAFRAEVAEACMQVIPQLKFSLEEVSVNRKYPEGLRLLAARHALEYFISREHHYGLRSLSTSQRQFPEIRLDAGMALLRLYAGEGKFHHIAKMCISLDYDKEVRKEARKALNKLPRRVQKQGVERRAMGFFPIARNAELHLSVRKRAGMALVKEAERRKTPIQSEKALRNIADDLRMPRDVRKAAFCALGLGGRPIDEGEERLAAKQALRKYKDEWDYEGLLTLAFGPGTSRETAHEAKAAAEEVVLEALTDGRAGWTACRALMKDERLMPEIRDRIAMVELDRSVARGHYLHILQMSKNMHLSEKAREAAHARLDEAVKYAIEHTFVGPAEINLRRIVKNQTVSEKLRVEAGELLIERLCKEGCPDEVERISRDLLFPQPVRKMAKKSLPAAAEAFYDKFGHNEWALLDIRDSGIFPESVKKKAQERLSAKK